MGSENKIGRCDEPSGEYIYLMSLYDLIISSNQVQYMTPVMILMLIYIYTRYMVLQKVKQPVLHLVYQQSFTQNLMDTKCNNILTQSPVLNNI